MIRHGIIFLAVLSFFVTSHSSVFGSGVEMRDSLQSDSVRLTLLEQFAKPDTLTGAVLIVHKEERIKVAKSEGEEVKGYRIRIFFDNSQKARIKAEAVKEEFETNYKGTKAYIRYSAPYFHVSIGNYLTHQEALKALRKVVGKYPKSFITLYDIPLKQFEEKESLDTDEEVEEGSSN